MRTRIAVVAAMCVALAGPSVSGAFGAAILSASEMRSIYGGCGLCGRYLKCGSDYCYTDFCGGYCDATTVNTFVCEDSLLEWQWCGWMLNDVAGCGYVTMMGVCDKSVNKCNVPGSSSEKCPQCYEWFGSSHCSP